MATNIIKQEPSSVTYKSQPKAVINELIADLPAIAEYALYVVNGVNIFRRAVVNQISYFDCSKIVESDFSKIEELNWEGFVSSFHSHVLTTTNVTCRGYWFVDNIQFETPQTTSDFICINVPNLSTGVDLIRPIKVIESIGSETWINTEIKTAPTSTPVDAELICYFDGVRTVIGDVLDTDGQQMQACSLKLPYSFIPLNAQAVRMTVENSTTLEVYCDTGTRDIQYVPLCNGLNNVAVGYLDRFNRWTFLPVVNYIKETLQSDKQVYDIGNSFMDYGTVEFVNDRRDKYIDVTNKSTFELETGFLSDEESQELKEVIASRYHYLFIDNVRYNATLITSSWTENKIIRDKQNTFKLIFTLQDESV